MDVSATLRSVNEARRKHGWRWWALLDVLLPGIGVSLAIQGVKWWYWNVSKPFFQLAVETEKQLSKRLDRFMTNKTETP